VGLLAVLAELYDARGRQAQAIDVYRRVLRQDPHNVVALNNLACLLALKGEPGEEARQHIESAIAEAGPQPELLDTLALVHLRGGRAEPALKALQQAVAREPSAAKYFHLAQAHLLAGERPAAKEAYQKALALGLKGADLHKLEQPALAGLPGKLQ
jgi:Tfp pilus assembly protein PilF